MVIGVAGKFASGKSRVAKILEERGFLEVDVDRLGHRALEEAREAVAGRFGDEVVRSEDGGVDRRRLGEIVFRDPAALRDLEAIVHPRMVAMAERIIRENPGRNVVLNAAILFPMGLDRLCDAVVWVQAPWPVRLLRAMRRDRLPLPAAVRRIRAQRSLRPQPSSDSVDIYSVKNAGSLRRLESTVEGILTREGL